MAETMAYIEKVGVGSRDCNEPVLWFDVTGDGWGALQVYALTTDTAKAILNQVYESKDLNGRTCIVDKGDNLVRFVKLLPAAKR